MRKLVLACLMSILLNSPAYTLSFNSSTNSYQDEGMKMYVRGTTRLQEQNYSEALVYLNRAVKLRPDLAEAFHNLGFAYEKSNDVSNAVKAYEKAIQLKPDYATALNNLGYLLATSEQDTKRAVPLCQRAVGLQPNSANFRDSLGWALYKSGKNQEAVKQFKIALKIDPNFVKSHFNLGLVEYTLNNYQNAIACFQNVIRLNASNVKVYVSLGDCYEKLGNDIKALNYYKQGLSRVSDNDPIKKHLEKKVKQLTADSKHQYFASAKKMQTSGSSKLQDFINRKSKSGQLSAQYNNYTQPSGIISETNTGFTPVSVTGTGDDLYSTIQTASNNYLSKEAIAARNARDTNTWARSYSVSSIQPVSTPKEISVSQERELERKYSLAKSYLDRNLINEAAAELNIIIRSAPQTSMVSRQAKNLLLKVEKQIDEKKTEKASTHSDMGKDFFRSGQYKLAENEFQKALLLDPENAETYKDLALLNYNQGKLQEAYEYSKKAIALNKSLKEAYIVLASLYSKKGRTDDAMRTLRTISEISGKRDAVDELAEKMMASLASTMY